MTHHQPQQFGGIEQQAAGGQFDAGARGTQSQGGQQTGMQGGQGTSFQGGGQQLGQGGQQSPQPGGATQPMDLKLEEGLTDEMRVALHDFVQSATVSEWCAERCIDEGPEMAECIRLCRDVADLATLNVQFISRDSVFGPEAAQVFAEAAEACAQECARHGHRHCQECAEVLGRAARSTRKMLASFEEAGGMQGQQPQTQQSQIGGQSQQQPGEMGYQEGQEIGGGTGATQSPSGQGF